MFAKARRGEPVTVGVIGGSITQGAKASKPELRSNYGALRAARDLLSRHPDFVVVEFAVNDGNTKASPGTM